MVDVDCTTTSLKSEHRSAALSAASKRIVSSRFPGSDFVLSFSSLDVRWNLALVEWRRVSPLEALPILPALATVAWNFCCIAADRLRRNSSPVSWPLSAAKQVQVNTSFSLARTSP
jgi:hypothetical protein